MSRGKRPLRLRSRQAAFTIVELMIVVVVITILVGIGIAIGPQLVRSAGETKNTLAVLARAQLIATEYENKTQQVVNHLANIQAPFDWTADQPRNSPQDGTANKNLNDNGGSASDTPSTIQNRTIERFVFATFRSQDFKKLYADFRPEHLTDGDTNGFLELRDGWGNKIIYVAFVKYDRDNTNDPQDDVNDNPDRSADNFLPKRHSYYFASAGPDGKWGDPNPTSAGKSHSMAVQTQLLAEAADNLYSFGTLEK